MAYILVVEDDIDIAQGIAEFLEELGHTLDFAYNGKQALEHIEANSYELILLDVNLPFVDGLSVCRSLLSDKLAEIPVIIMSAKGETKDVLAGFDSGAWDYLIKPFSFAELSARIQVGLAKSGQQTAKPNSSYKGISLDESALTISFEQQKLQLHKVGFDIVKLLLEQAPDPVKTQDLHRKIWGEDTPDSDPLRAHIYKLRKQFENHFEQSFITTVKSVGYKFDVS